LSHCQRRKRSTTGLWRSKILPKFTIIDLFRLFIIVRIAHLYDMILIPQRLFDSPSVKTIFRDGNVCILKKSLNEPVENREGYISNHVVSIVLAGEQKITTYEEEEIQVRAGEVVFIPRGLYYITDLLPSDGAFESVLFYFDEALIEQFLSKTKVSQLEREAIPEFLKFGQVPMLQLFVKSLLALYGQGDSSKT